MIKCFVIGHFRGTCSSAKMLKGFMLICRNAEGLHCKRKVGNPCTTSYTTYYSRIPAAVLESMSQTDERNFTVIDSVKLCNYD